jgi:O-antigen ligase
MRLDTAAACVAALFLASCVFGHMVSVRLLLLGAGIVLSAIVVFRQEVRALPPIWIPFLLWGGWALLSLSWSLEPERTLKEWRNEVFYTGTALWVCFVSAQTRNAIGLLAPIVGAAAAGACAIALFESWRGLEYYMVGWHGGPGDHSSALLVLVPCAAMAGWYSRRASWPLPLRLLTWAIVPLFLLSAYMTLNRTIWFGLGAELLVIAALLLWRARRASTHAPWSTRAKLLAGALACAVALAILTALAEIQAQRGRPLEQDQRLTLWPLIVEQIERRPSLGYGFGRGLLRTPLGKEFGTFDPNLWHAHNIFLDTLLQVGLPGLALLLVLLWALLREGWRLVRHPDDVAASCGVALMGVVAGMLVRNMTDTLLVRQNALLFWGIAGVLLALGRRPR